MRFVATTELPALLGQHGFRTEGKASVFDEEAYPLVEMPAPHLCADRLDYGLRDAVAFGKMTLEDARRVFLSLKAHPNAESPRRLLALQDEQAAHALARAYTAADRDVWGNPAHMLMYQQAGRVIGDAVRRGCIPEQKLWSMSDGEFWEALRAAVDDKGREAMVRLERDGLPSEEGLKILPWGKVRTLDPDVCVAEATEALPLSLVNPAWGLERQSYIAERNALRA